MTKYHINKHGIPAPCKAKKGNCPFGGESIHFDTKEKAQMYADESHRKIFGILPEEKYKTEEDKKINERMRKIKETLTEVEEKLYDIHPNLEIDFDYGWDESEPRMELLFKESEHSSVVLASSLDLSKYAKNVSLGYRNSEEMKKNYNFNYNDIFKIESILNKYRY